MHLIFERSDGHFGSNCNILALAWMPYYDETRFRHALLEYHQRQLMNIASPGHNQNRPSNSVSDQASNNNQPGPSDRQEFLHRQEQSFPQNSNQPRGPNYAPTTERHQNVSNYGNNNEPSNQPALVDCDSMFNARVREQYQRYVMMKYAPQSVLRPRNSDLASTRHDSPSRTVGNEQVASRDNPINDVRIVHSSLSSETNNIETINDELDLKYGRMIDFGWLALGNVGKMIGVTLTSALPPPIELDTTHRLQSLDRKGKKRRNEGKDLGDLIVLDDGNGNNNHDTNDDRAHDDDDDDEKTNILAGYMKSSSKSKPFNDSRPDKKSSRTNYNLRGHLDEVVIVEWNELYQKLATVDSKGNVLIWCKLNGKFTIQTPFYNRTKTVADFKWSNDGKTALICYTDSFILVGSSSGQRHWHSMLNLEDYHITCASWTPNDEQLLLGVSNKNVVMIDLHRSELIEIVIGSSVIRAMSWTSNKMNLRDLIGSNEDRTNSSYESSCSNLFDTRNSRVVSHRRLSRDCSVFSRFRFAQQAQNTNRNQPSTSQGPEDSSQPTGVSCPPQNNPTNKSNTHHSNGLRTEDLLAVDFADSTIGLYRGGITADSHMKPLQIQVNLESYTMSWSTDGKLLAVAGFNIYTRAPSVGHLKYRYMNVIRFYNRRAKLVYEFRMRHSQYPITAFTWAHQDQRIFVATGPKLHCARVLFGLPSLAMMSLSTLQRHTKLADKVNVLESLFLRYIHSFEVLNWKSYNCPLGARKSIDATAAAIRSRMAYNNEVANNNTLQVINNTNAFNLQMHAKLAMQLDKLFAQTIRQPYDVQLSPTDIAWHVPKNNQRLYCTLICYTCEPVESGTAIGPQYRTEFFERQLDAAQANGSNPNGTSDQYKIFILYAEFQGSLIPILKARRIGFMKPEFVIFDPEEYLPYDGCVNREKVFDINHKYVHSYMNCHMVHTNRLKKKIPKELISSYQVESNCMELHEPMRHGIPRLSRKIRSSRKHPQGAVQNVCTSDILLGRSTREALARTKVNALHKGSRRSQTLPESKELVRLKSNVWGTRFKLVNVSNRMIKYRRVRLGYVEYKASLLHLQPRQICLSMKDMSNYCTLCTIHHHSRDTKRSPRRRSSQIEQSYETIRAKAAMNASLIDLPISGPHGSHLPPLPPRSGLVASLTHLQNRPLRSQTTKAAFPHENRTRCLDVDDSNKVILPVGDSIKIAPRLEANQKYIIQSKPSSGSSQHNMSRLRKARQLSHEVTQSATKHQADPRSPKFIQPRAGSSMGLTRYDNNDDDILTLSLDQGDQVRVEMSSISSIDQQQPSTSRAVEGPREVVDNPKLNELLKTNKTLKSIQKITQMIVDLSSKADQDDPSPYNSSLICSSSKLNETSPHVNNNYSPAKHFVPPQAPVHRPRHNRVDSARAGANSDSMFSQTTQSANNTPVRGVSRSARKRFLTSKQRAMLYNPASSANIEVELPPPPRAVSLGRRLTSSAKRFFDGSLRSLTGVSGYSTATETDTEIEECEPLVSSSSASSQLRHNLQMMLQSNEPNVTKRSSTKRYLSQPGTPLMRSRSDVEKYEKSSDFSGRSGRQQAAAGIHLTDLKTQLMHRFIESTKNWRSSETASYEPATGSSTKKSGWIHKRPGELLNHRGNRAQSQPLTPAESDDDDIDDDDDDLSDSSNSISTSDSFDSELDDHGKHHYLSQCYLDNARHRDRNEMSDWAYPYTSRVIFTRTFKSLWSTSVTQFKRRYFSNGKPQRRSDIFGIIPPIEHFKVKKIEEPDQQSPRRRGKKGQSRPGRASICKRTDCCCAREIKLSNRPPVWNEQSQVYQLDFSGRVTQESAKNLQIDYQGKLALQFGRIDRCTYTLDYKYPFNAVQAMSVALASLTQRLK